MLSRNCQTQKSTYSFIANRIICGNRTQNCASGEDSRNLLGWQKFLHLTEVCITLVYAGVKTDQTVHLRYAHFPVYKLYPNFKKKMFSSSALKTFYFQKMWNGSWSLQSTQYFIKYITIAHLQYMWLTHEKNSWKAHVRETMAWAGKDVAMIEIFLVLFTLPDLKMLYKNYFFKSSATNL